MSNSYTKASFVLTITAAEAALLRSAIDAVDIVADDTIDHAETEAAYAALPEAFRDKFPPIDANALSGFLAIFSDPCFPSLDADIVIEPVEPGDAGKPGEHRAHFYGEQFGVEEVANLIHRLCPSTHPCGFEWASDCDRFRDDEFGGGYVVISAKGVSYASTRRLLEAALGKLATEVEAPQDVLTTDFELSPE